MKPVTPLDPITIITSCTTVKEPYHLEQFKSTIQKLYCYEIFKPILDLVATKAMQGHLKFNVHDQRLFDLDEGNCRTIEGSVMNKFLNRVKTQNNYIITIKKISAEIIIHEIAHMVEKEIEGATVAAFANEVHHDLRFIGGINLSLSVAANQIMGTEIALYPEEQHNSELFARYFQLLSLSKEIAGHSTNYGYVMADVHKLFIRAEKWLLSNLYSSILPKIDASIAQQSLKYIKAIEDIQHPWAGEKVQSVHYKTNGAPKWSKALKSIKEDPFQ